MAPVVYGAGVGVGIKKFAWKRSDKNGPADDDFLVATFSTAGTELSTGNAHGLVLPVA